MLFGFGRKKTKKRPIVRAVSESALGLVRKNNEDHLLVDDVHLVYCVADGMGGGADGEQASEIVCAEIAMMLRVQGEVGFAARMESVCNAIICSNTAIRDYSVSMGFDQMGTTVAVIMFDPEDSSHAVLGHVGDSRVYRFRKGTVKQLTNDHSIGAELGRKFGMDKNLANRSNPLSHVLTRAIGTGDKVYPDWKRVEVKPGDRFLLCTDGVHDVLEPDRLRAIMSLEKLEEAKEALSKAVLNSGAPDNFSYVILEANEICS